MPYLFKTAPQQLEIVESLFSNTKSVKRWLDTLISLDGLSYIEELLYLLQSLKTLELSNKDYFIILEKIQSYLTRSTIAFDESYWENKFPLNEDQLNNLEIMVWVNVELANNYYQLAVQLTQQKRFFQPKKKQAALIYQALKAMSQVYLKTTACYTRPYQGFWTLLYNLYFLAEKNSLLKTAIDIAGEEKGSIEQIFKQVLFISICDTHQFRPQDMQQIYDTLKSLTEFSHIRSSAAKNNTNRTHIFSQRHGHAPQLFDNMQTSVDPDDDYRYLIFTDDIRKAASDFFAPTSEQNHLIGLKHAVFFRAYKSLISPSKRQQTRIAKKLSAKGVVGFGDIIKFHIDNQQYTGDISVTTSTDTIDEEENVSPLDSNDGAEYIDINIEESSGHLADESLFIIEEAAATESANPASVNDIKVLNSSFSGYQVLWKNGLEKIQIGNILGLHVDPERGVEVGVIRNINTTSEGLVIGIKLLDVDSRVISVYKPDTPEKKISCILFNQNSLLYSSNYFRLGDSLYIDINDNKTLCRLSGALHSTSSIDHFKLQFEGEQRMNF